jgi:hypothetical protein
VTHLFAYLDPGSSSMIVQMLLGGFAAVGVALKLYWRRFKRMLGFGKKDADDGLYTTEADEPTVAVNGSKAERVEEPAGSSKS